MARIQGREGGSGNERQEAGMRLTPPIGNPATSAPTNGMADASWFNENYDPATGEYNIPENELNNILSMQPRSVAPNGRAHDDGDKPQTVTRLHPCGPATRTGRRAMAGMSRVSPRPLRRIDHYPRR
jgi:hypothetical protein